MRRYAESAPCTDPTVFFRSECKKATTPSSTQFPRTGRHVQLFMRVTRTPRMERLAQSVSRDQVRNLPLIGFFLGLYKRTRVCLRPSVCLNLLSSESTTFLHSITDFVRLQHVYCGTCSCQKSSDAKRVLSHSFAQPLRCPL